MAAGLQASQGQALCLIFLYFSPAPCTQPCGDLASKKHSLNKCFHSVADVFLPSSMLFPPQWAAQPSKRLRHGSLQQPSKTFPSDSLGRPGELVGLKSVAGDPSA